MCGRGWIVTETDLELIRDVLGGDHDAFESLMKRYEHLVFKVAYSFARDREEALDLTQTVFLKAFRGLESFRTEADFKTWLLRITYNEGVNWVRKAGREGTREDFEIASTRLAHAPLQEERLVEKEEAGRLRRGLDSLNERYRTAIILRYHHGMPIREIAGVLQCSETMTKNILFRGVRNLRRAVVGAG